MEKNLASLVEQLEYAASDESGQFCEALEILSGGRTHFVLHFYHSYPSSGHEKVDYKSRRKMLSDFPYGPGGFGDRHRTGWKDTDPRCGYSDVPLEEFNRARDAGFKKRIGSR